MCCFPSHHHDHLLTYLKGYLVHLTHNVTVREVNSFWLDWICIFMLSRTCSKRIFYFIILTFQFTTFAIYLACQSLSGCGCSKKNLYDSYQEVLLLFLFSWLRWMWRPKGLSGSWEMSWQAAWAKLRAMQTEPRLQSWRRQRLSFAMRFLSASDSDYALDWFLFLFCFLLSIVCSKFW